MTYCTCQNTGCEQAAEFSPKLMIPRMGARSGDEAASAGLILGTKLCRLHAEQIVASRFLMEHKDIRRAMITAAQDQEAKLNFFQAWTKLIALESEEYKTFERMVMPGNDR